MILLADSGSTKTDWVMIGEGEILHSFKTPGLNPYFVSSEEVAGILHKEFSNRFELDSVGRIYFYGAGCSTPSKKAVINNALKVLFPGKQTEVDHDMLAAARALFGNQAGIACILGTGSNACSYDGNRISESLFSTGYMFGDEGSGAHLGKTYIAAHLKSKAPDQVMEAFDSYYGISREEILTNIYKKTNPNRFLASFTPFLREQLQHPYVREIVEGCFDAFFEEQVCKFSNYDSLPVGFIGSVAFHFSDMVKASASKFGIRLSRFEVSPMGGLIKYHAG